MTTTTTRERAYLHALRKRRKLTQEQLGIRIGVSRNTVGRMEAGDEHTDLTTVMRALAILRGSPWSFCELVVNTEVTLDQMLRRQNIVDALTTYIDGITPLRTAMLQLMPPPHRALLTDLGLTETLESRGAISEFSLLLTLILLDVPRADVAAIVFAADNHVALGRQLAERRITSHPLRPADLVAAPPDQQRIPLLASAIRRLQYIERHTHDSQPLYFQAMLAIAAINQYLSLHQATYAEDPFAASWDDLD
ncbi:MAG TPA: helix-turn-helix transcriptional regulator [Roseiflexaceae bacterium]|nr:helix-turn-helix transcriptional regulator [Roseiflexaceae bacterium]